MIEGGNVDKDKSDNKDEIEEDKDMEVMSGLISSSPFDKMKAFVERLLTPQSQPHNSINKLKKELEKIKIGYEVFIEDDGSYTLSLKDIDIIVNDKIYNKAIDLLISDLKEYSLDYCRDLKYWYSAPNRKSHYKYVIKAMLYTNEELKKDLIWQKTQS